MIKYPRIGVKRKPRDPKETQGLPCIICGKLTTGKVDIETNWFRGDDDQVRVCAEHQKHHDEEIIAEYAEVK